jgi:molecular chaperone Hsp33
MTLHPPERVWRWYDAAQMKRDPDTLHRFLFEHAPIRGEIVHLDTTWRTVQQNHDYPPALRQAMGELMAAAALLTATLKLKGSMILQIQGKGPVSLLVVECTGDMTMRATAKWSGELTEGGLAEMIGDGRFVITLDPKNGKQTYQGIVPLEGGSVAEILQNYMTRSEQLETRLFLAADNQSASGMLLQKLPAPEQAAHTTVEDADTWPRACQLADTLKPEELLQLPAEEILHRLYHEEDIRLFDPQQVGFHCGCSRESVANMLRMLGRDEVDSVVAEQGGVEVHCEFCNRRYGFDPVDVEQIFTTDVVMPGSDIRH